MKIVEKLNGEMVERFATEEGDKKSPHFVRHVILRSETTEGSICVSRRSFGFSHSQETGTANAFHPLLGRLRMEVGA